VRCGLAGGFFQVVIPWRGFRCFTQTRLSPEPELEDVLL